MVGTLHVLHLTENPVEAQLLQSQVDGELAGARVKRVADAASLARSLGKGPIDLLVVDLPLWDDALDNAVARAQSEHPELAVLFRWKAAGTWHYADGTEPLAGIVRQTLRLEPARPQSAEDRQQTLARVVAAQEVFLRLAQTDFWDFEPSLRLVSAEVAELLGVERVGVWELEEEDRRLRCLDLFERTPGRHSCGKVLADHPRYVQALSTSLMIAAHDALEDPRTREFRDDYLIPLGITSMLDAPIRGRGKVRGVVCFEHVGPRRTWDVLEQCHAASAASLLAQALETRDRRRLEDRLRESERLSSIGRTAARLAHDFNNRLTVIRGEVELALQRPGGNAQSLSSVLEEVQKAGETARGLMNLHRERREPSPPVELGPILTSLRPALERLVGRGVRFELEVDPRPLRVAIAPVDFEHVLFNLVTNARDALPVGGRLRITLGPGHGDRPRALLRVEDDGIGMDEESRKHLFEPFFSSKASSEGSGLGLASVFAVVREAGGEIAVESHPGLGTCIFVELPLA